MNYEAVCLFIADEDQMFFVAGNKSESSGLMKHRPQSAQSDPLTGPAPTL